MATAMLILFVVIPTLLGVINPAFVVYYSILTGPFPSFSGNSMFNTAFGIMDISSLRLLAVMLISWFVTALNSKEVFNLLFRYPFHLMFLAFCLLSFIWAPSFAYSVRMLLKLTAPFVFLILVMITIKKESQLDLLYRLITLSGILAILIALITKVMGVNHDPRFTLPQMSPALFSAHLVTVTVLIFSRLRYRYRSADLVMLVVIVLGIVAAFTRITIAAVLISLTIMSIIGTKSVFRFILPGVCSVSGFALFLFNDRFKARMFIKPDAVAASDLVDDFPKVVDNLRGSGRFKAWHEILSKFFYKSPVIGSGAGATQHFFYTHSAAGLGVIHSEYVRMAAEIGTVGLLLFAVMAVMYFVKLSRNYARCESSAAKTYSLAAIGALCAYLIFMATDNAFDYVNGFGAFVFILIGMSEKARELELLKPKEKTEESAKSRIEPRADRFGHLPPCPAQIPELHG
jgi:O-antigen ligase